MTQNIATKCFSPVKNMHLTILIPCVTLAIMIVMSAGAQALSERTRPSYQQLEDIGAYEESTSRLYPWKRPVVSTPRQSHQQPERSRRTHHRDGEMEGLYADRSISYERFQPGMYERPSPPRISSSFSDMARKIKKRARKAKRMRQHEAPKYTDMPYFDQGYRNWVCPAGSIVKSAENQEEEEELEGLRHHNGSARREEDDGVSGIPDEAIVVEIAEIRQDEPTRNRHHLPIPKAKELDSRLSAGHDLRAALAELTGHSEIGEELHPKPEKRFQKASIFGSRKKHEIPAAQPASCQPELSIVPITEELEMHSAATLMADEDEDAATPLVESTTMYYPTCTRIERCGGCCSHELLECQPTEIEYLPFRVMKTEFVGSVLKSAKEMTVEIEKHNSCACDCKVKEEDCMPGQVYLPHECRCMCRNSNEEHLCRSKPDLQYWDGDRCRCVCRNPMECSTGMQFDDKECRCKRIRDYLTTSTMVPEQEYYYDMDLEPGFIEM